MPSPKAFSSLRRKWEPMDWGAFLRELPWQPIPQWLVFNALGEPVARAFPTLARASCGEPLRTTIAQAALVAYLMFVPGLAAAAVYFLVGRKRLTKPLHRVIAAVTLAVVLFVSASEAWVLFSATRQRWPLIAPGWSSLRAACWP